MIRLLLLSCLMLAGCAAAPVPGSDSAADPTQVETRPSLTFAVEVTVNADDDKLQAARQFYAQLGISLAMRLVMPASTLPGPHSMILPIPRPAIA